MLQGGADPGQVRACRVQGHGRRLWQGATSFRLATEPGCRVDGINFCEHHVEFAERIARKRGWDDQVRFHLGNMVQATFADETTRSAR